MSDYTVTTDFSVKDALNSGDPNKLIKGSDVDVEFDAIAVAVNSKADKVSSPTTNNLAKLNASGNLVEASSISDNGTDVTVATAKNLKIVDNGGLYLAGTSVTSTAAELNKLDGCTSSVAELNLLTGKTGTIWTSTNDGASSGLDADLLDGQHGSYYRNASNINAGSIGAAYLPTATTIAIGALEVATNAEAQAKAASDKIIVPSNLGALGASATFAGLVELATDAEVKTGTDTSRAVTAANLRALGGEVLLQTVSPSAASTVDFDTVFEDYTDFKYFIIRGFLYHSNNGTDLSVRVTTDSGSTWLSSAVYYNSIRGSTMETSPTSLAETSQTQTACKIIPSVASSAGLYTGMFELKIFNPQDTTSIKWWMGGAVFEHSSTPAPAEVTFKGTVSTSTAVDGIRFFPSAGTVTGEVQVYGII